MKRIVGISGLIIAWALGGAVSGATVRVDGGQLQGMEQNGVMAFKGIPYAAAPVGALRWRAPQPAPRWRGERIAGQFGNACVQEGPGSSGEPLGASESEDCLYLNVWRPKGATRNLPVMVWIHGGALRHGAASQPRIDGSEFARRGIVLVSFNYRLGWLGFFGHPALTREAADGGRMANYGLMDQIAALQWVQRNIRAFGGDPRRVTIFGESAGGASVLALLIAPTARGLYSAAISQSGYWRGPWARVSETAPDGRPSAEASGLKALAAIGATAEDSATLRALSIEQVRRFPDHGFEGANFIRDGKVLPEDLWPVFRAGRQAGVPLLIGATDLETPVQREASLKLLSSDLITKFISLDEQETLVGAYGGRDVLETHLASDLTFAAHAFSLARLHRARGFPTFRYRFAAMPDAMAEKYAGTPHAGELSYVFHTLQHSRWPATPRDAQVAEATMAYWIAFARAHDLQPPALPAGKPVDDDMILHIGNQGPSVVVDDRAARYRALAAILDPRS